MVSTAPDQAARLILENGAVSRRRSWGKLKARGGRASTIEHRRYSGQFEFKAALEAAYIWPARVTFVGTSGRWTPQT